ncbi:MAG: methyltransferase [Rhodospirillaceae bacterium]|jgi:tRNA1(Val) A37 N6-methylase TrmN6|nr:methyltransferase [Rhodospirillaceae bacterium]MBT5944780.1 methyltransferase [Rhodospirillaceae bacterium]MBT6404451.1 methyltransferase [Rhodospirillaceae bacterium]MBT6536713.1 methyltransferase [Rhodospirillaceae bacterium]MBT7362612.1 methyltransferase [Rhodospirillaceae bacterium]
MTVAAETTDRLLGGRVEIRQPGSGFRVSVDAVLLAAAVSLGHGQRALDVGCGAGGATLCLASRLPQAEVLGVDRDARMSECLRANISANKFEDRVAVETMDVAHGVPGHLRGAFDHVFSNPPYLPAHRADSRTVADAVGAATIESLPFADWLSFMAACCRPKGRLTIVHRADRLEELLAGIAKLAGEIRVLPIWPRADAPAKRVIITARVGVQTPTVLCPGLVLHAPDGAYTLAAREIIEGGSSLAFGGGPDLV